MQPAIQEPHRSTHTGTTTSCKTHRRNNSRMKRPQPHPPHRRGTFLRWLQPLYTEKHKVSCSGFLTKKTHATLMLCNRSFKNRIELRTQEQPLVGIHIGGTIRTWNDPSRTSRTDEAPFIAGCSHFTRKNTRFRAPASSPKHSPCNIHAAIPMRSCNQKFKNRIELRTQEQPLVAKHIGRTIKRTQQHPPHRRGAFFCRLQPLYTEKHKVSCSSFLPKI